MLPGGKVAVFWAAVFLEWRIDIFSLRTAFFENFGKISVFCVITASKLLYTHVEWTWKSHHNGQKRRTCRTCYQTSGTPVLLHTGFARKSCPRRRCVAGNQLCHLEKGSRVHAGNKLLRLGINNIRSLQNLTPMLIFHVSLYRSSKYHVCIRTISITKLLMSLTCHVCLDHVVHEDD